MSTSFSEESVVAVIEIPSIAEYTGGIPAGYDLVEYEAGTDPYQEGMVLYGFDEVGMFEFNCPQHAFVNGTLAELVYDRSKPAKIIKTL
jgi:hypothetical protein|tara:strand:- start:434 stop:700 length:267 start_codon:yes stop_codon:yes gene_type:complete